MSAVSAMKLVVTRLGSASSPYCLVVMQNYLERLYGKVGNPQELIVLSDILRGLALFIYVDDVNLQEVAAAGHSNRERLKARVIQVATAVDIQSKGYAALGRDVLSNQVEEDSFSTIYEIAVRYLYGLHSPIQISSKGVGCAIGELVLHMQRTII